MHSSQALFKLIKKAAALLISATVCLFTFVPEAECDSSLSYLTRIEADYILSCQYLKSGKPAYGCINNIYGAPTWVVPRENAMAILGLIEASKILNNSRYSNRAQLAADYLVKVQDKSDGAWYDQYSYTTPVSLSKSPTQTAEVMIAFYKLGYTSKRYKSMKKGAQYLFSCQNPANKGGNDDGLLSGGKDASGIWHTWRWASDNAYAYLALRAAEAWAIAKSDTSFANQCDIAAQKIIQGIDNYLYVSDPSDPDYGVWRRVVDRFDDPVDPSYHDWINYAPQMLDLPARGVGLSLVGDWIHSKLQQPDGACVWDDLYFNNRKSPGLSFQASLCWLDLGQDVYAASTKEWAETSGLWQTALDPNGIRGGWIDWIENGQKADWWLRFIDTSFYAIAAFRGGYDFSISSHFYTGYSGPSTPALADLNSDGNLDIIVTSAYKISAFTGGGISLPGWPVEKIEDSNIINSTPTAPAVADIDKDGKAEVVAGISIFSSEVGYPYTKFGVAVFDHKGNLRWWQDVSEYGYTYINVALGDLDNDGKLEIIAVLQYGMSPWFPQICVFDYQGNILPDWPKLFAAGQSLSAVALADIDKDGYNDILFTVSSVILGNQIYVVDRFGDNLSGWPQEIYGGNAPAVADVNGDGDLEISTTGGGYVYLWDMSGESLPGWPLQVPIRTPLGNSSPVFANIDLDPEAEILVSTQGDKFGEDKPNYIYAFNIDGSLAIEWLLPREGGTFGATPIVGNIDLNNNLPDILIPVGNSVTGIGELYIYPEKAGWPKSVPGGFGMPALGDVNGDGKTEVVVGSSRVAGSTFEGYIHIFLTQGKYIPQKHGEWQLYRKDNQRTGLYSKQGP